MASVVGRMQWAKGGEKAPTRKVQSAAQPSHPAAHTAARENTAAVRETVSLFKKNPERLALKTAPEIPAHGAEPTSRVCEEEAEREGDLSAAAAAFSEEVAGEAVGVNESPEKSTDMNPEKNSMAGGEQNFRFYITQLPTKGDIQEMLQVVTSVIKEEIRDIKREITALAERTDIAETNISKLSSNQKILFNHIFHQNTSIQDLHRQLEDLENRNRRNNIRIRGVPETVHKDEIYPALNCIFNTILKRGLEADMDMKVKIKIERAHRVQKSKAAPPNAPRDILCCLHSFSQKEEIIQKSRKISNIEYENNKISVFQDLLWITLSKRKLLKPLTVVLREKNIFFRWGFPFSLAATKDDITAVIRLPADTVPFFKKLQIPEIDLPGWFPDPAEVSLLPAEVEGEWSTVTTSKRQLQRQLLTKKH